jgi:MoxR-like ATPase/Mg-chelatase subunit ChlD
VTAIRQIQQQYGIVGREQELDVVLAVLGAGRHLLVEGPAGVGKSALVLAVCAHLGRGTRRVDGDDRYAEDKLVGWFDPPQVVRHGYGPQSFFPGPLTEAMRRGCVLFVNELDRMPETVQNVLLPALDEGFVQVPHLGEVWAEPGFQVVATRHPMEDVATGHLSEALRDRFEHLSLDYQSAADEAAIVAAETGSDDLKLIGVAVRLARATRRHPRFRRGASVRGAVAIVDIAGRLDAAAPACGSPGPATLRRAAGAALTSRVELRDAAGGSLDDALDELVERVVVGGEDLDAPATAAASGKTAAGNAAAAAPPPAQPGGGSGWAQAAADRASAVRALAARLGDEADELDGWRLAATLTTARFADVSGEARIVAERLAAAAVLRRAATLVGPLRGATRLRRETLREPYAGELDVEATLENISGKPWPEPDDWQVRRRVEQRRQVVLMVDTSLSMAGENMALAAVAAAVLALKVHAGDLAVVLFAGEARPVLRLGERPPVQEIVRRLLARPCGGATDVAAALEAGAAQLERASDPRRAAVLVSDGVYTAGADPRPAAGRFASLDVLLTGAAGGGARGEVWVTPRRQVGRDLAAIGRGHVVPVASFAELPRRMLDLAERVLR